MKALVYHGPGKRRWEEKPKPTIKNSTDAIIRITKTTICGTDLHIMKGDVPEVIEGLILGHEGVGDLLLKGLKTIVPYHKICIWIYFIMPMKMDMPIIRFIKSDLYN